MASEQAAALAEKLSTGTWTHDYPIMAEEVYQVMGLFPQPTRTRPSVEYVPLPYRSQKG